ncbi:Flp pilus assembly protein CpaB [Sporomusa acidovorans]|uniref:SAF domain-containing protein n=1 Tax=Sporomusa acidovorans (strain ATCC 49682 / DSM 3132 / Mol) TaxID=1123286 RepID=A0ABZ3IX12_SPOA4|nr:Flp pilus assembly protein CpaB [Sporomusa acidovorans]OZC13979.1 SAF domain protein [Sporomusa acidovorans DSM 3132]SDF21678.1 pilus assembly protein CpaB [Sporomusa acidovorans]
MIRFSNKGLLLLAVILSLLTTALVYSYLKKTSGSLSGGTVAVVVAKADIAARTRITPEMVQTVQVPAPYLQPGGVQELQEVIGMVAKEPIVAGEQITVRRLIGEGRSAGFTGMIPTDKRAMTIGVNEVTGVAGFVKAGDYVDVVVTFEKNTIGENVSRLVLQNVLVLAANRETEGGTVEATNTSSKDKKEISKTATVTLAVTPDEATKLTLSEDKGKVRLVLRPFMQNTGIDIAAPITPPDIVGLQHLPDHAPKTGDKVPVSPPSAPAPAKKSGGIQMIRGTKTEVIAVN